MRYWYDCEFHEDGSTIDLLSIGIVAEDGRELYAVNADADWYRVSKHPWLVANVVPHLPVTSAPMLGLTPRPERTLVPDMTAPEVWPKRVIAERVREFIRGDRSENELWADFGAYDHVVLCQLFGTMMDLPQSIPMWTHDLQQIWEQAGRPPLPARRDRGMPGAAPHHALADARHLKEQYDALTAAHGTARVTYGKGIPRPTLDPSDLDEGDEVCICTPAWCFSRCAVCMGLTGDLPCPGQS